MAEGNAGGERERGTKGPGGRESVWEGGTDREGGGEDKDREREGQRGRERNFNGGRKKNFSSTAP